jgi:acyl-CoA dehydrogenase
VSGLTTGLTLSAQQTGMLDELNRYLDEHFPTAHEGPSGSTPEWGDDDEYEWVRQFNAQLARDGWLTAHWPEEYGGRGLAPLDNMLIREQLSYRRVPIANANGLDMLAPILLQLGTTEQKDAHLRKIALMEEHWCQGFSEPEAGSDLTSLRTTAIREGDHYVVNGSKIWTGHAMRAEWMILLARTDPETRGSRGLSLLMVDLRNTPGIEIHPIRSLTGAVTFCQEFFTDVRVPVANLVGPEHSGWRASQTLLEHERVRASNSALYRRDVDDLLDAVVARGLTDRGTLAAVGHMIERVESARAMTHDVATVLSEKDRFPPHAPSVMKILNSRLGGDLTQLGVHLLGLDVCDYRPGDGNWDFYQEFLFSPVSRLGGGSTEIHHDIIGTRFLGLDR